MILGKCYFDIFEEKKLDSKRNRDKYLGTEEVELIFEEAKQMAEPIKCRDGTLEMHRNASWVPGTGTAQGNTSKIESVRFSVMNKLHRSSNKNENPVCDEYGTSYTQKGFLLNQFSVNWL